MQYKLYNCDCLDALSAMRDESVDSIITDPPYGLSDHSLDDVVECLKAWTNGEPFKPNKKGVVGMQWDAWVPGPEVWKECLRVLKPGGHLLAFAGTRSMDLMSMAVRLAGFKLRDSIGYAYDSSGAPLLAWVHSMGFPKGIDISKQIDKQAGAEREIVARSSRRVTLDTSRNGLAGTGAFSEPPNMGVYVTAPATENAKKWEGWNTTLKPAWEPIILAQKPIIGTYAENVVEHGTGALNIRACRIPLTEEEQAKCHGKVQRTTKKNGKLAFDPEETVQRELLENPLDTFNKDGRWPANVITDGSKEVHSSFPKVQSMVGQRSAARFFYSAKPAKSEKKEGVGENKHVSVKPVELMKYLIKLVTPPGGTVMDPFMGSGTTGKAACEMRFRFVGVEIDKQYFDTAEMRIRHATSKR